MKNRLLFLLILPPILFTFACQKKEPEKETPERTTFLMEELFVDAVASESGCTFTWYNIQPVPPMAQIVEVDSLKVVFLDTEFEMGEDGEAPVALLLAPGADHPDTFTVIRGKGGKERVGDTEHPYFRIPIAENDPREYSYIGSLPSIHPPNGDWSLTLLSQCDRVVVKRILLDFRGRYQ